MTVSLMPVDAKNWRSVAGLVADSDFVSAVTYYLCLCTYGGLWQPLAVEQAGETVGFVMWAEDDDHSRWIGGLVVDAARRRRGIGRAIVRALQERFAAEPGCPNVALSYSPENTGARDLYASLGFRETGETEDDEVVARWPCR
jgi:diamine N-acetyltransferase